MCIADDGTLTTLSAVVSLVIVCMTMIIVAVRMAV